MFIISNFLKMNLICIDRLYIEFVVFVVDLFVVGGT